jgi:hypothetical protein
MILPKKETSSSTTSNFSNLNLNDSNISTKNGVKTEKKKSPSSSEPVKLSLTNLQSTATMKCTAIDVYNALTRPEVYIHT